MHVWLRKEAGCGRGNGLCVPAYCDVLLMISSVPQQHLISCMSILSAGKIETLQEPLLAALCRIYVKEQDGYDS